MKYFLWIIFIGVFISSCEKDLPFEHVFSLGEDCQFDNIWYLTLIDIPEDSRCPFNAECLWDGRVVCTFKLSQPLNTADTFALSIGAIANVPRDTIISNYSFELLKVDPQADINREILLSEYKARILIEEVP